MKEEKFEKVVKYQDREWVKDWDSVIFFLYGLGIGATIMIGYWYLVIFNFLYYGIAKIIYTKRVVYWRKLK